jgi:hypothetical protein
VSTETAYAHPTEPLTHPYVAAPDGENFCWHRDTDADQRCGWAAEDHPAPVVEEEQTPAQIVAVFRDFITALEPADLKGTIDAIETEPLPAGDERRAAAMNRADRAELVRLFLAVRETGRGIVRRLEDDETGRLRSE